MNKTTLQKPQINFLKLAFPARLRYFPKPYPIVAAAAFALFRCSNGQVPACASYPQPKNLSLNLNFLSINFKSSPTYALPIFTRASSPSAAQIHPIREQPLLDALDKPNQIRVVQYHLVTQRVRHVAGHGQHRRQHTKRHHVQSGHCFGEAERPIAEKLRNHSDRFQSLIFRLAAGLFVTGCGSPKEELQHPAGHCGSLERALQVQIVRAEQLATVFVAPASMGRAEGVLHR